MIHGNYKFLRQRLSWHFFHFV